MLRIARSMDVKLFLQQRIDGRVQVEREARWPIDAQAAVDIKAALTLDKAIYLAAAKLVRLRSAGLVEIALALAFVIRRHSSFGLGKLGGSLRQRGLPTAARGRSRSDR